MTFIKGNRVELRVLEDSDAEIFTKEVNKGLTTQHLFTGSIPMRTKDYAARWQEERKAGDILFGVWTSANGVTERFIGTCGLHQNYPVYRRWEFRILIFDADSVGKGIGSEAVRLATSYAFRALNARRVWLGVSAFNKRAVKSYIDCDYLFEGRSDDAIYYDGVFRPTYTMRILRKEWKSLTSAREESEAHAARSSSA